MSSENINTDEQDQSYVDSLTAGLAIYTKNQVTYPTVSVP